MEHSVFADGADLEEDEDNDADADGVAEEYGGREGTHDDPKQHQL